MTNHSTSWREGDEVTFFKTNDGEGISFYNGLLYPLNYTSHIPESSKTLTATSFLGGTTIDSGIYYLTSSDESSYIVKNELNLSQDSEKTTLVPENSAIFYSISDGDVLMLDNLEIAKPSSAPKYKESATTGTYLGNVTLPVGWYKMMHKTDENESPELQFTDLSTNKVFTLYATSASSNYIYVDERSAISLDNASIESSTPVTQSNQPVSTWMTDNIEENIPIMQTICNSEIINNIYSIYYYSYNSEYDISYKNETETYKNSEKKELFSKISAINNSSFLNNIRFNEYDVTFVFNITEKIILRVIYCPETTNSNYIQGMPLSNHPNWYYEITEFH